MTQVTLLNLEIKNPFSFKYQPLDEACKNSTFCLEVDGWSEDMIISFKSSASYIAQTRCGVILLFAQERTCMSNIYIETESGGELN